MKLLSSFLLLTVLMTSPAVAGRKVAVVKLLKGDVDVLTLGKTSKLKVEDWVEDGSVVKTAEKSFVKLLFVDKSQMNIGPSSEMKIEKFGEQDSGVIDLVKGKIRSQVTKDYLQMDRNKSKLFIKTPNAVLGVRGTDFLVSTNGITSSAILFEGAISFNKLQARGELNTNRLEDIVDRGVAIRPGEFSVVDRVHPLPTVPAVLNIQQRQLLEKNPTFEARSPGNTSSEVKSDRSIVPAGLAGEVVSNNTPSLTSEVPELKKGNDSGSSSDAKGFVGANQLKPANGSALHIASGSIFKPVAGSPYDKNTNSFVGDESFTPIGELDPGKNKEITDDGKIFERRVDPVTKREEVREVVKEIPVIVDNIARVPGTILSGLPPIQRLPLPGTELPPRLLDDPQRDLRTINQIENKDTSKVILIPTGP